MSSQREPPLSEEEEEVLEVLSQEGPKRIEEVAESTGMDYIQAKKAVHHLWNKNLVVSGPQFRFDADRSTPPNLA